MCSGRQWCCTSSSPGAVRALSPFSARFDAGRGVDEWRWGRNQGSVSTAEIANCSCACLLAAGRTSDQQRHRTPAGHRPVSRQHGISAPDVVKCCVQLECNWYLHATRPRPQARYGHSWARRYVFPCSCISSCVWRHPLVAVCRHRRGRWPKLAYCSGEKGPKSHRC